MADINVQMPSENEDFDAVTTSSPPPSFTPDIKPAVSTETPDFSKPAETVSPTVVTPVAAAAPAPVVTDEAPAAVVAATPAPFEKAEKGPKKAFPVWPIVTAVLAAAVIGLGAYSFVLAGEKKDVQAALAKANANPQLLVQKQTDDLITKVGALMTLPSGETPTVANVSDAAKAKQQSPFFANAENGDRVLMYVKAGQAILYRPSTDKIILVAPLTFNNDASTGTASTTTKK